VFVVLNNLREEEVMEDNTNETNNEETPAPPMAEPTPLSPEQFLSQMRDIRRRKIERYEETGCAKSDPFDSCLTLVIADLLSIENELAFSIKQSLADRTAPAAGASRLGGALDSLLKVMRQADRFMQLEVRAAEANKRNRDIEQKLQALALEGHLSDAVGGLRPLAGW
jgi:hypothetical protein